MTFRCIVLLSVVGLSASAASAQDLQWNNASGGSWNVAGNWNPMNVPDTAGERAILSLTGMYTVSVAGSVNIGQLWVSNPAATLQINNAQTLGIAGPQFTNDGHIVINSNAGGSGTLIRVDGNTTLDGTGDLLLHANGGNLFTGYITQSGGATLTQGPDHLIHGRGVLALPFVNNGTVQADENGFTIIDQGPTMNNALMGAINGGILDFSGSTLTQSASGQVVANNATVRFLTQGVTGGTVTSLGTGESVVAASSTFTDVTVNGTFQINNGNLLAVAGNGLTHAGGTITINPSAGGSGTLIRFDSPASMTGPGVVVLNANAGNLDTAYITSNGGSNVYTNGTGHTIRGSGRLAGTMVNNGTVNADVSARTIEVLANPTTNNGLFTSSNSGILQFSNNTVTSTGATIGADNSTLNFSTMGLVGGLVAITNGGIARVVSSSTFTNVTVSGPLEINNGQLLAVAGLGLTHADTIKVNATAGGSATLIRFDAPGTLAGPGAVVLNANAANLDTAYITSNGPANIFTNGAGHTIRGLGRLYGTMINNGTVNANVASRTIEVLTNPTTNTGLFTATGGGVLQFSNCIVGNSGATIAADASTVNFSGMGLTGGQVNITNGGIGRIINSSTFTNVTVSGPLEVNNGQILAVAGLGLTHADTITVNPPAGGSGTLIRFDAPGTLAGSGTVVLNANGGNLDTAYINSSSTASVYTNGTGHTIRGQGRLYGVMVNDGTVNADVANRPIEVLANPTTNHSTFTATNGGVLQFSSTSVDNTSATISSVGGTVNFTNMGLTGGQVNISGGGIARILSPSTFTDVTVSGPLEVNNGQILAVAGAGLTHVGTITINPAAGGSGTLMRFDASGTLAGSGSLVLNANSGTLDTAYINTSGAAVCTNGVGHTIAGRGRIYGNFNNNGIISPGSAGDSTGRIERIGTYAGSSSSAFVMDIGGTAQGSTYDWFNATGAAALNGTLTVRLNPGYIPPRNTQFTIISAPSVSGVFTTVNLPALPPSIGYARLQYLPNAVRVLIPLCPTDWNGMDGINSQDFFDFLSDFFAGTADFNFDGFINSQDFFDFLTSFFGGCAG